jgi:hypothetical protein
MPAKLISNKTVPSLSSLFIQYEHASPAGTTQLRHLVDLLEIKKTLTEATDPVSLNAKINKLELLTEETEEPLFILILDPLTAKRIQLITSILLHYSEKKIGNTDALSLFLAMLRLCDKNVDQILQLDTSLWHNLCFHYFHLAKERRNTSVQVETYTQDMGHACLRYYTNAQTQRPRIFRIVEEARVRLASRSHEMGHSRQIAADMGEARYPEPEDPASDQS